MVASDVLAEQIGREQTGRTGKPLLAPSLLPGGSNRSFVQAIGDMANAKRRCEVPAFPGPEAIAHHQRHVITDQAGVAELAQGLASSVEPVGMVEGMLSDIMAASYNGTLRLIRRASTSGQVREIAMLTRASGQMMKCFTDAVLTLQKLRSGGRQSILVQHVAVEPGARAIITGTVNRGSTNIGVEAKSSL